MTSSELSGVKQNSLSMYSQSYSASTESVSSVDSQSYDAIAKRWHRVVSTFDDPPYRSESSYITPGQVNAATNVGLTSVHLMSMRNATSPAWVLRVLELCKRGNEDAALKEISLVSSFVKFSGKLQQFSADLESLNVTQFPDIVLIGLLRNTYSMRAHIPSWDRLLRQTEKSLISHKKNPRSLLRGLKSYL